MARAPRRLAKERKQLTEEQESDGKGEEPWFALGDSDETYRWTVTVVGPAHYAVNPVSGDESQRASPYAGALFQVQFDFQPTYPMVPPKVKFLTPVYHPNVKKEGEDAGAMCADFVSKEWKPSETVRGVLEKIVALLASPNAEEPLEASIGAQMTESIDAFEAEAKAWVKKHCDE